MYVGERCLRCNANAYDVGIYPGLDDCPGKPADGRGVPAALTEITALGRTLKRRAADVLAYFDRPGTSNGPTEAINGRLEHLRGSALGFRNITNYHRQVPARNRRIQTPTTPPIVKSR